MTAVGLHKSTIFLLSSLPPHQGGRTLYPIHLSLILLCPQKFSTL